jgi:integrase
MIEYVFLPSRRNGKRRVKAKLYSGRYSLARGEKPRTVALDTPDRVVAAKRLRDLIVEKQREREGIIPPAAVRAAAASSLLDLATEYEANLKGRQLSARHVCDTMKRLRRVIRECGWARLLDVRPDTFSRWRAGLSCSAKTKKEYQVSACAFLNWLVRTEQLPRNPLAQLDKVETKGKQVRSARAFSPAELQKLLAVAGRRRIVYLTLLYTGQRKSEVKALVLGDLHLAGDRPHALFREGTTKDKEKRAVPLHPLLAQALREFVPADGKPEARVYWKVFPHYETLRVDLDRAGIAHRDSLGRVLHFHSFRKTFQTLGVMHGINQRSAQELLGHSDANLTAKVYTDVPALALHAEIAKLPWFGDDAQVHSQKRTKTGDFEGFLGRVVEMLSAVVSEGKQALEATGTDGGRYWTRTSDPLRVKQVL